MTIGRIGGPMLKENLVRQGVDLSIETDLLYFDVNNMRIGVNTLTPNVDLDINGITRFSSNLQINGGTISTYADNNPITLTPHGTGKVRVSYLTTNRIPYVGPNGELLDSPNLTFDGDNINIGNVNLGNLAIYGNNIQTTNVDGNVVLDPNGAGTVIIDSIGVDPNRVLYTGLDNELLTSASLAFDGSNLILDGTATISTLQVNTISSTGVDGDVYLSTGLGNVILDNSAITNAVVFTGSNKELLTNSILQFDGTTLQIGNITLFDNTISTVSNNDINLDPSGTGKVVIVGTNSVTIPAGDTSERPAGSIGDIRYNTDTDTLEFFNGVTWNSLQEASALFEFADAFNGDGSSAEFSLSHITTSTGAFVSLNGVVQSPGVAYGVSGNTLTFTEAPAIGDRIDVRYLVSANQLSLTEISNLTSNVTVAPAANININVNGNLIADFSAIGFTLKSQNSLIFADSDNSNYVGFTGPATVETNTIWTLPAVDGTNGQALLTNGAGELYWGDAGTGGSGASVTVSSSAPVSPTQGDLWWNNTIGTLKLYYNDGTSGQWVDAVLGRQGVAGYTGSAGAGYTGSAGELGYTGSSGLGYTGSAGAGYTGSQGIQGDLGYTGSAGINGYTGSAGINGYTGSAGINGYTGSVGANGYTGSIGYTGSMGTNGEMTFVPPTTSTFTSNRAATGTITNMSGGRGVRISAPGTSTDTNNLHYAAVTPVTNAGNWQVIARFRTHRPLNSYAQSGIVIKGADGKAELHGVGGYPSVGFTRAYYTSDTVYSTGTGFGAFSEQDYWMKITNVGSTREVFVSKDGDAWTRIMSYAPTQVTTADIIGIVVNPNSGNLTSTQGSQIILDCLSWQQDAL